MLILWILRIVGVTGTYIGVMGQTCVGKSRDSTPLLKLKLLQDIYMYRKKRQKRKGEGRWIKAKAILALLQHFYILYLYVSAGLGLFA